MGGMITKPSRNRHRAEKRQAVWDGLSPQEKLDALDKRLGMSIDHKGQQVGAGAKRQRAKLAGLLKEWQETVITVKDPDGLTPDT